jgi:hypothetical protein
MPYLELFACDDKKTIHYELQTRLLSSNTPSSICTGIINIVNKIDLELAFENTIATKNRKICIPLQSNGFRGISAAEFSMKFDPNFLKFESASLNKLFGSTENSIGFPPLLPNTIWFSWTEYFERAIFLQPQTQLFEFCFTALAVGSTKIWIDTLNRMEFYSPDFIPLNLSTKPGIIQIKEAVDYTLPIKSISSDSIPLQKDIKKINLSRINIFPNPSNGKIFIIFPEEIEASGSLVLKDLFGQVLKVQRVSSNKEQLDLSPFLSGVHFLEIHNQGKIWIERIVIFKPNFSAIFFNLFQSIMFLSSTATSIIS